MVIQMGFIVGSRVGELLNDKDGDVVSIVDGNVDGTRLGKVFSDTVGNTDGVLDGDLDGIVLGETAMQLEIQSTVQMVIQIELWT